MPTYEYRREDGSTFELFQSMSDDALTICPTTGQPVKRIISGGTGVLYKGTGFYVTDYKNNGAKNGSAKTEDKTDEAKPAADKKADTGSDSKAND
ncbi:hypothetical protein BH23BAC3_BH23BAC3_08250 [soil metagenome]